MKALLFGEYGPADVLHLGEADDPHPGPGQVRIAVRAAGVNPVDWKIRSGASQAFFQLTLPHIPGMDAAGVVDEIGEGVTSVAVGDEIFGSADTGASAQYALLTHFARKPAALSWAEAGGLPSAVETASRAIDLLGVADGNTVLVNGVAGGVGLAAAQLIKERGASVIGTASEGNHAYLSGLGITPTTYGDGLAERVRALAPGGVDLALDAAGHGALPALIELTGSTGKVITVADMEAEKHGVRFTAGFERRYFEAFEQVAGLIEEGRFTLPVQQTFPLADGADAHRISEAGHVRGKLVLVVD